MLGRLGIAILRDVGLEAPAGHPQGLHARADVARQRTRGGHALARQLQRLLAVGGERCGEVLAQHRQVQVRALERLKLGGQRRGCARAARRG